MEIVKNPARENWASLTQRPAKKAADLGKIISEVFENVQMNGDQALKEYTLKFDKVKLQNLQVTEEETLKGVAQVSEDLKAAMDLAKENIKIFHASQFISKKVVKTSPGVECWQEMRPIEKVGLYIPGGTAPLFSTILMLGIPAKLAGCKEIILCTPPSADGTINPAILYAAQLVGVTTIFKLGGVQAIAAMTYGTESVPSVYKIFGPGNQFVTGAKQFALTQGVAIDMPAGPSELMVVADQLALPEFVASDLLSQAEHGHDSQVICLANTVESLEAIQKEVAAQLEVLPRKEMATSAIENSQFILIENLKDQIDFINDYAPEHLILNVVNEDLYLDRIMSAGSVFIGPYTPESAGDYASGTNHTLPTNAYARMYSGVNMDAFTKKITFQKISEEGIQFIGPAIELMAEAEGLEAHKNAVTLRLKNLEN
ncbi:histidinol dehydrogenase [Flavicella sediminum]|uniref:histidinol dehydrogenase n=1 Tax=Flavicella sediminum TaxID=2585141 RepID=UPI00111CE953|nr:histidinol dehydrogenase [Flavicella sediminum]